MDGKGLHTGVRSLSRTLMNYDWAEGPKAILGGPSTRSECYFGQDSEAIEPFWKSRSWTTQKEVFFAVDRRRYGEIEVR